MQTRPCPHCGAPVPVGDHFCGECGRAVDSTPVAPAPPAQSFSAPPAMATPPPYAGPPIVAPAPRKSSSMRNILLIGGGVVLCLVVVCVAGVLLSGVLNLSPSTPGAPTPVEATVPSLGGTRIGPPPTKAGPPGGAGAVIFQDDFSDPTAGGWKVTSDQDTTAGVANGQFEISIFTPNLAVWSTNGKNLADGAFDVDVVWQGGPSEYTGGLIVRENNTDYYAFRVNTLGQYSFYLHQNDNWTELVSWTDNSAVLTKEGDRNHLSLVARGDTFVISVNDHQLDTVTDGALARGQYGLIASVYDTANAKVAFDNFIVRKPAP